MKVFEPFRLDTVNFLLWRAGERIPLTPKAFDILRYLVEHADRLVTQDEILEALWTETYVNPEGIRKYILEIRKVLGDRANQPLFIETLPKRGYQFVAKVSEEHTPAPRAPSEGSANLVGRNAALIRLSDSFERALGGQRQAVFVTGEAGIGKTTLVDAFQQQVEHYPNLRIARGQCIESFGGKEAYYPILEALGSLIQGSKDGSFVQTLGKQAPTWLAQFPAAVRAEERSSLQREILGSTRGRMVREICEALEALTTQAPLLLILEDLHWVDFSTLDFISAFARRREPAKLLLVGTYRPVDVVLSQSPLKALKQDLLVHHLCREIAVERLEESDVAEYLEKTFTNNKFPARLAQLVHHNSGGNALFMVAIVRDMVKKGLLAEDDGAWTVTAPFQDIYPGVPETLQEMLEIQFEQLSAEEQSILQGCSVAGERFSAWAAEVMLKMPAHLIEAACDRLAHRQQFIRFAGIHRDANGADSAHYEFRHSLYRQALYRRLSGPQRSQLHRNLGAGLLAANAANKRELASELAVHFEEGRDYEQASRYLILSAENAGRRFAHGDCIRVLQHALELTFLTPEDVRSGLEIQILQRTGDAHYALGAMSDSASAYETAAARAEKSGLVRSQIEALNRLAVPAWYLDAARGNEISGQVIEVSRGYGDPLLLAQTQLAASCLRLLYDAWRKEDAEACVSAQQTISRLGGSSIGEDMLYVYVRTLQGDYKETLAQAEAGMIATNSPAAYILALEAKTLSLIGSGRLGDLLQIVRSGRESARKNGEDPWLFIFREAWLRVLCFDFAGAVQLSKIIMRSDAEQHAAQPRAIALVASGYAELDQRRCEAALQYFAEVRDRVKTPKFFLHWRWRMRAQQGSMEALLLAGKFEEARRESDGFLESALSTGEPNLHAFAWEASARVAIAQMDRDRTLTSVENALAVLDRFDVPVAGWRVHATAWHFYTGEGEMERAEDHRYRAQEMIMGIADSFELGEPLRESLLAAAPVQRILMRRHATSAVLPS